MFDLSMVNEPSGFEPLKFYLMLYFTVSIDCTAKDLTDCNVVQAEIGLRCVHM